ncbi:MAG TPA: hypothetical protein VFY06_03510 [Verrucomicrobiae bacterium]|nr:hypothetical protein [Verrucomicrobiae bacterium]
MSDLVSVKIACGCGQQYTCEVKPRQGLMPAPIQCPHCGRDGTPDANRFLARTETQTVPVKITCVCGQKYAFDVQPHHGRMPVPVFCPACSRDGTIDANQFLARIYYAQSGPLPPPSVNILLSSVQSAIAPQLVEALKDAVVRELASQRRQLLTAQQQATAELTELARQLEAAQMPLLERLRLYEQRISELEKELSEQSKENHELLKLKIEMTKQLFEAERAGNRLNFN